MSQPSLVPRARPLAGPGQSPGLASLHPVARAGNGHEVYAVLDVYLELGDPFESHPQ
jgi:hypothetical protein